MLSFMHLGKVSIRIIKFPIRKFLYISTAIFDNLYLHHLVDNDAQAAFIN